MAALIFVKAQLEPSALPSVKAWEFDSDNAKALIAQIDRTETLSKQVLALINLNALLLREASLCRNNPLEHFARLEAEIGGFGEAIARGTAEFTDVPVSSQAITEVFGQVLRQARVLVENAQ